MSFLYNQFLRIIDFLLPLIGLFSKKVNDFVKGRKSTIEKITINFNDNDNVLWFHSASLGEFEQGSPVISEVKKKFRNHKILLTFFSPSGYNTQKNYSNVISQMGLYPHSWEENGSKVFLRASQL